MERGLVFPGLVDNLRNGPRISFTAKINQFNYLPSQDEESGIVMLKRHLRQQRSIDEYGKNIKQLASRAQKLLAAGHPEG